jgi:deazaflavin-dependent oxidoreductase (nitroreductase family)
VSTPTTPAPPPTPLLRFMRPLTLRVVNPVTRLFAGRVPGFGILEYRGRKSGKAYRTPLNVFRNGDEYLVALTYGSDVQWVRNVVAAGEATLRVRGRQVRLTNPRLFVDPARSQMPQPVRAFLGLMRVTEFLRMRIV